MTETLAPAVRWQDAASVASFTPNEPVGSSERWAGGFGGDGNHLEVIALVQGVEVSVDTSLPEEARPDRVRLRKSIAELLWRHTLHGVTDLELPYSVNVISDDRSVMVDDTEYAAHGMRIEGDTRWVGVIQVNDVTVRISTTSSSAPSLRTCTDPDSLSESPPAGH